MKWMAETCRVPRGWSIRQKGEAVHKEAQEEEERVGRLTDVDDNLGRDEADDCVDADYCQGIKTTRREKVGGRERKDEGGWEGGRKRYLCVMVSGEEVGERRCDGVVRWVERKAEGEGSDGREGHEIRRMGDGWEEGETRHGVQGWHCDCRVWGGEVGG